MPIHDWTRVDAGLFHHFHQNWIARLSDAINLLAPHHHFAQIERSLAGPVPSEEPSEAELLAARANHISLRRREGGVVAVLEIISPGNKTSEAAQRAIVDKAVVLIRQHVNLLVIDLFPPAEQNSHGIYNAIWHKICAEPFDLPADKPLTLVSYNEFEAIVYPTAVGDELPDMPLYFGSNCYVGSNYYVPAPLEATYMKTWRVFPSRLKHFLE